MSKKQESHIPTYVSHHHHQFLRMNVLSKTSCIYNTDFQAQLSLLFSVFHQTNDYFYTCFICKT